MKRFLFFIFLAASVTAAAQQKSMLMTDPLPLDTAWRSGVLPNGMTYFVRHNGAQPGMANFYMVHHVGAIQEDDDQTGLAHFLEHMAFQGSKHFPGDHMLNYLEGLGLQFGTNLNAATGIESTQYFLQDVPVKRAAELDSLLLILHDWSGYLTLDPRRIDNERRVIIEEHRMRNTVDFRTQQRMAPWLYGNTRYSHRDLIGSDEFLRSFSPAQLQAFYKKWYRPDLQAVIVVGDINADDVVARLKRVMADIPKPMNAAQKQKISIPDNAVPQVEFLADPDMIGLKSQLYIKRQAVPRELNNNLGAYVLRMTTQMLGVLTNLRFQDLQIQEGCPFASAIFGDGPVTETCDALQLVVVPRGDNLGEAFSSAYGELERVRRLGFGDDEFKMAQTALLQSEYQHLTTADRRQNSDYGRECVDHFVKNTPMMSAHDRWLMAQRAAGNITRESLNQFAAMLISPSNNLLVVTTPEKTVHPLPTADQLRQFFSWVRTADMQPYVRHTVTKPLMAEKPRPGKVTKTEKGKFGSTVYTLGNGSRVVARHTGYQPGQVLVIAQSRGGMSLVSDREFFAAGLIPQLIPASGVGRLTAEEITRITSPLGIAVVPRTDRFSGTLSGTSTKRSLEQTLQLMYLYLTQPNFNEALFRQMTAQMGTSLAEAHKQPQLASRDALNKLLNGNAFRAGMPKLEAIKATTFDDLKSAYRKIFTDNATNYTYYIVGDYDESTLPALIAQYVGSLPKAKIKAENKPDGMVMQKGVAERTIHVPMSAPKAYVSMAWTGEEAFSQSGNAVISLLAECLRIRCLETLRQEKGGVYGINLSGTLSRLPEPNYQLTVEFQTDPKRAQEMTDAVKAELKAIAEHGPDPDDMKKAMEFWRKQQPATQESNTFWYSFLQNYYENGLLWETDRQKVEQFITAEAIQKFARHIIDHDNLKTVIVMPAEEKLAE